MKSSTPALARPRAVGFSVLFAVLALLVSACGDESATAAGADHDHSDQDNSDHGDGDHSDHGDSDHGDGHGDHDVVEVPEAMAVPTITIEAEPDAKKGANVSISLADFEISPENASTDPVDGQGHMHLYVDGERVMRFYNTDVHLGNLAPGEREIMVEVSANNHSAYAVDGEPIRAMATVEVPESADEGHNISHGDGVAASEPLPAISIAVSEDPKSGHNVAVELTNFTISPDKVNTEHVDGEGHLHLYIDGERQGRLYGLNTHVAGLESGTHEITVELSANDHSTYLDGETPISASATVEVAG